MTGVDPNDFVITQLERIASGFLELTKEVDQTRKITAAAILEIAAGANELKQAMNEVRPRIRELEREVAKLDARIGALELVVDAWQSGDVPSSGDVPDDDPG